MRRLSITIIFLLLVSDFYAQNTPGASVYQRDDFNLVSGNAYDIFRLIPSLDVSGDGTVSISGQGEAQIMIDNRLASPGGDYQPLVEQLLIHMIEQIEVITSPSARNDAEAAGGIVNIILAGDGLEGYNGTVSAKVATGEKYDLSAGINYSKQKWDIKLDVKAQQSKTVTNNHIYMEHYLENDTIYTDQHIMNKPLVHRLNTNASVGYTFNEYHDLLLESTLGYRKIGVNTFIESISTDKDNNYEYQNYRNDKGGNIRSSLNYNGLLSKKEDLKKEISANLNYYSSGTNNYRNLQLVYDDVTYNDYLNASGQVDYLKEISARGNIESGLRTYVRKTHMDYNRDSISGDGVTHPITEDNFKFNEQVHAAYVQYSDSLRNYDFSLGLRTEISGAEGIQVITDETFLNEYIHFFPSLYIGTELSENSKLDFNYSSNTTRPSIFQMNPFINDINPNNIQYGNPGLKPTISNNFELKYNKKNLLKNLSTEEEKYYQNWSVTFMFRKRKDQIYRAALASEENEGVIENSFYNLKSSYNIDIEAMYSTYIFNWWKIDLSPRLRHINQDGTNIDDDIKGSSEYFQIKVNSNFDIGEKTRFIVGSFYRSAHDSPQGRLEAFGRTNLTFQHAFLDDKLTLIIEAKDPFGQSKIYQHIRQTDFIQDREFELEKNIVELRLRFNFGQLNLTDSEE